MINTSIHLNGRNPKFDFSGERENRLGESYRRLAIEVTGMGYTDIYLTKNQAIELADTIYKQVEAEEKEAVAV